MSYDLEQTVEGHRQTTDPLAGTRVHTRWCQHSETEELAQ
jgi:hypothetical protein